MFCYTFIRDFESIGHLHINPILRIGLIHKLPINTHWLKWRIQVDVFLSNCKQNISSLSLLVGTTVTDMQKSMLMYPAGLVAKILVEVFHGCQFSGLFLNSGF